MARKREMYESGKKKALEWHEKSVIRCTKCSQHKQKKIPSKSRTLHPYH